MISQAPPYPLPGLMQGPQGLQMMPQQNNYDRDLDMHERARDAHERERDREYNDHMARERRERDLRERDSRERMHREQLPAHQSHVEAIQIHQPSAVGPQVRSAIHGPNGILSNGGPPTQSAQPAGPLYSPHYEQSRLNLPQTQQIMPQQMLPFGNGPGMAHMPVSALSVGLTQGQQPILNVSLYRSSESTTQPLIKSIGRLELP